MQKNNLTYRRGEICWVNFEPTIGAETKKIRPGYTKLDFQKNICSQTSEVLETSEVFL